MKPKNLQFSPIEKEQQTVIIKKNIKKKISLKKFPSLTA